MVWLLLMVAVGALAYGVGLMTGKALSRKKVLFYERSINGIGRFARSQSAVGDPSATIVADMIEDIHNNKEVN